MTSFYIVPPRKTQLGDNGISISGTLGVITTNPGGAAITGVGALRLDTTYSPTWTGTHTFTQPIIFSGSQAISSTLISASGQTAGDLFYYTGTSWSRLAVGSNNQILQSFGGGIGWTGGVNLTNVITGNLKIGSLSGVLKASSGVVSGNSGIGDLSNVLLNLPASGNFLKYNGTNWVNSPIPLSDHNIIIRFLNGYTPVQTGIDIEVATVPYEPSDGTTVLEYTITRIVLQVEIAGSTSSQVTIERALNGQEFDDPMTLGNTIETLTLTSGSYQASSNGPFFKIYSGERLRLNINSIGTGAQQWTVQIEGTAGNPYNGTNAGITSINSLAAQLQTMVVGSGGTDFNISSVIDTHTFNIPSASGSNRGLVTTTNQTFAGIKTFNNTSVTTSTTTGSVIISGGVGIGESIYIGGNVVVENNLILNNALGLTYGGTGLTTIGESNTFLAVNNAGSSLEYKKLIAGTGITFNFSGSEIILESTGGTGITGLVSGGGISSLNGISYINYPEQSFAVGSSGTDFNIVSIGSTHTFNLPEAGSGSSGIVTTNSQIFAGSKTFNNNLIAQSDLNVTGATNLISAVGVSSGVNIGGGLGVTGASILRSTLQVTGITTILNSTNTSSSTSGALVVSGGIGASGSLYVGSGANFNSNNISSTSTSSGFVFSANSLTTGTGAYINSNSLTTGKLVDISVSGNTAIGNRIALNVTVQGTNVNTTVLTYGIFTNNISTNTATNIGLGAFANGDYNNIPLRLGLNTSKYINFFINSEGNGLTLSPTGNGSPFLALGGYSGVAAELRLLQSGGFGSVRYVALKAPVTMTNAYELIFPNSYPASSNMTLVGTGTTQVILSWSSLSSGGIGGTINAGDQYKLAFYVNPNGSSILDDAQALTYSTSGANLTINSTAASVVPLKLIGAVSQTADLLQVATSSSNIFTIDKDGIGSFTNNLTISSNTSSTSSSTGALTVTGGLGVQGRISTGSGISVAGDANFASNVEINSLKLLNNLSLNYGGTGLGTSGLPNQILGMNSTSSSLEYKSLNVGFGITISNSSNSITLSVTSSGSGISSINGLTSAEQTFAVGVNGTNFNIESSGSTHTFNLPSAGSGSSGIITTGPQSISGNKSFIDILTSSGLGVSNSATFRSTVDIFGGLGVTGATVLNSSLTVATSTVLNSTLNAIGNVNFATVLNVGGTASLAGVGISGNLDVAGGLGISGKTLFRDSAIIQSGGLGVTGGIVVSSGGLGVTGSTTLRSTLSVLGTASFATINQGTWNGSTIGLSYGGTGLGSTGTANQFLGMSNDSTGLEYKTFIAGSNVTILHSTNSITISTTSSGGGSGVVNTGLATQVAYYAVGGTSVSGTSNLTVGSSGVGISFVTQSTSSTSGALVVVGGVGVSGNIYAGSNININNAANIGSGLGVSGNTNIYGGLGVTGSSLFRSSVVIQDGGLGVTGATLLNSSLTVSGSSVLNSTLNAIGNVNFASAFNVGGASNVAGLGVSANLEITGGLGITGKSLFRDSVIIQSGGLGVSGGLVITQGGLGVTGATILRSTLSVLGTASFAIINQGTWNGSAIGLSYGGTGLGTSGTANQILGMSNNSSGLEYKTLIAGSNVTILNSTNSITISSTSGGGGGSGVVNTGLATQVAYYAVGGTSVSGTSNLTVGSSGVGISFATQSTSSTSGALVVFGGIGVSGNVRIGSGLGVSGTLNFVSGTFGNVGSSTFTLNFLSSGNSPISLNVLSDNSLSFEGSSGQLLAISNNLSTGFIYSINNISGLPLLRANANGNVSMGEFAGNIGVGISNPQFKLHVIGDTNVTGGFGVSGLANVSGGLGVTGYTNLSSTLIVQGNAGIVGGLGVTGSSLFRSSVIIQSGGLGVTGQSVFRNNIEIQSGGLGVTGGVTITGSGLAVMAGGIGITGQSVFRNNVEIQSGGLGVTGTISSDAITIRTGGIGVTGQSVFRNNVEIQSGGLGVTGAVNITSTLGVQGSGNFSGGLGVTGALNASSTLGVQGSVNFASGLGVTGTSLFRNNVEIQSGGLGVTGAVSVSSTLGVQGSGNFGSGLGVTGAVNFTSTLGVQGSGNFSGGLGVTGASLFRNTLTVQAGGLGVTGGIFITQGGLGVTGAAFFSSSISAGSLSLTTALPITSGGTGLNSTGAANQILGMNNSITGLEYKTFSAGAGIAISHSPNVITVISSIGTGISSLNGLSASTQPVQTFGTGISGTEFNIVSAGSTHTFNIPAAGTGSSGTVTTGNQTFAGAKTFNGALAAASTLNVIGVSYFTSAVGIGSTLDVSGGLGVTGQSVFRNNVEIQSGGLGVTGAVNVSSTLGVQGSGNFGSGLGVTGAVNFTSTLGVQGSGNFGSGLGVTGTSLFRGNVAFNSGLGVTGQSVFRNNVEIQSGGLGVTGAISSDGIIIRTAGLGVTGQSVFRNNIEIQSGGIGVTGGVTITGSGLTIISGGIGVTGQSVFRNNIEIQSGGLGVTGGIGVTGRLTIHAGGLGVTGAAVFNSSISAGSLSLSTPLPLSSGGTGLGSTSLANYILGMNSSSLGLEYKQIVEGSNITITHNTNSITIAAASSSSTPGGPNSAIQYNGSNTLAGTSAFLWDNSSQRIDIKNTNAIGTGTTTGFLLQNSTASTVSVQMQFSPGIEFVGRAWKTSGSPATDTLVRYLEMVEVTSGGTPTGAITWKSAIHNASNQGPTYVKRAEISTNYGLGIYETTGVYKSSIINSASATTDIYYTLPAALPSLNQALTVTGISVSSVTLSWISNGTVASGASGALAYYSGTGTTVDDATGLAYASSGTHLIITSQNATDVPLRVDGHASSSVNLFQVRKGTSDQLVINSSGNVSILSSEASTGSTSGALIVTGGVGIGGTLNVGANLSISGLTTLTYTSEKLNTKTSATGTVTHDLSSGSIFYHSSISSNFTANFTNVPTTNDRAVGVTLILAQGVTPYMSTALQIDGSAQTIKWVNNTTPTGTASKVDIVGFSFIRTGSAWTVLGQYSTYG